MPFFPVVSSIISSILSSSPYYIHTRNKKRGTLGIVDGHLASTNPGSVGQPGHCDVASTFAIIQSGGDYYLYSVADKRYITQNDTETDEPYKDGQSAMKIYKRGEFFVFDFKKSGFTLNVNHIPGIEINQWGTTWYNQDPTGDYFDDGNLFTIEEIDDFDPTEALAALTIYATGISVDMSSLTMTEAGQTSLLIATVLPENTTDKSVGWMSSDVTVATVDDNGLVTAVANGTAEITATTQDGTNLSATCVVTVDIPAPVVPTIITDLSELSDGIWAVDNGQLKMKNEKLTKGIYIVNGKKVLVK